MTVASCVAVVTVGAVASWTWLRPCVAVEGGRAGWAAILRVVRDTRIDEITALGGAATIDARLPGEECVAAVSPGRFVSGTVIGISAQQQEWQRWLMPKWVLRVRGEDWVEEVVVENVGWSAELTQENVDGDRDVVGVAVRGARDVEIEGGSLLRSVRLPSLSGQEETAMLVRVAAEAAELRIALVGREVTVWQRGARQDDQILNLGYVFKGERGQAEVSLERVPQLSAPIMTAQGMPEAAAEHWSVAWIPGDGPRARIIMNVKPEFPSGLFRGSIHVRSGTWGIDVPFIVIKQ